MSRGGALGCLAMALYAAACGGDDTGTRTHEPSDGGSSAATERPSAISPACVPPPDCLPLESPFLNLGVCCGEELRCGFDMSVLAGVLPPGEDARLGFDAAKPCWPRSAVFFEQPGSPEQRVPGAIGREDILVTPDCPSRLAANTPLIGCCLPDGACGLSTHLAASTLAILADSEAEPFAAPECVSAAELNAQLAASSLKAIAHVPASTGGCDHAALNARVPR